MSHNPELPTPTSASASASTQPVTQQPTAQEILQSMEREYQERSRELATVRESLSKSQEQVMSAQDAAFRAFQLLSAGKERYLVSIISQHQAQTQSVTQELSKVKQQYSALVQQINTKSRAVQELSSNASTSVDEVCQSVPRDDNVSN